MKHWGTQDPGWSIAVVFAILFAASVVFLIAVTP